ncbi:Ig-like domain-containing protein [Priestia megaterium]|uniref:Ig-like domain-containing protein n=1 Tax=Priestia megaterium TaxID=1404 RepID=UPI0035C9B976
MKAAPVVPAVPKMNAVSNQSTSVTGTAEANTTVYVKIGSKTLGIGMASSKGVFNIKVPKQKAGTKLSVTVQKEALM